MKNLRPEWSETKRLLKTRLEETLAPMLAEKEFPESASSDTVHLFLERILRSLDEFEVAPFTAQRLSELIKDNPFPSSPFKYLRSVEKNLLITKTTQSFPDLDSLPMIPLIQSSPLAGRLPSNAASSGMEFSSVTIRPGVDLELLDVGKQESGPMETD